MIEMIYITIDGDDIGQRITRCYLSNDAKSLAKLNEQMREITGSISTYLEGIGFSIIFCGADGVAGYAESLNVAESAIFHEISSIAKRCATFSVGTGASLRESYVALMAAKSLGKAQLYNYKNLNC